MAPSKAVAWPDCIYEDADVLSLDEQGRFIVCRVCAESFAVYGGKTPKPVAMNACFRMRAWETHKRRTRAHITRSRTPSPRGDGYQPTSHQHSDRPAQDTPLVEHARSTGMPRLNARPTIGETCGRSTEQSEAQPSGFLHLLATVHSEEITAVHRNDQREDETRACALDSLLNPLAAEETKESEDLAHHSATQTPMYTGKRQRSSRPDALADRAAGRSAIAERSATHALYWRTMRELFSRAATATQNEVRRPRSLNGETDEDGASH